METFGIEYTEAGEKSLSCRMTVGDNMMRPGGIVHGGATMALIETVGSSASLLFMDPEKEVVLGIDVSANHVSTGRKGRRTHGYGQSHTYRALHSAVAGQGGEPGRTADIARQR